MPTRSGEHPARPPSVDPANCSDDQYEHLAFRAHSVNPRAARTCPWCLYDLGELLDNRAALPCPECARQVSGQINLIVWGKRARHAKAFRFVTFGWAAAVVVWAYLAPFVIGFLHMAAGDPKDPGPFISSITGALVLSVPILAAATPFIVFACCERWLFLRNPTTGLRTRLLIAAGAALVNTWLVVLGLWPYISLFTTPWP